MQSRPDGAEDDVREYLAFGDLGVDSVVMIDHFPTADEKLWVEPVGDFPGGMMGNAAVTVASLGVTSGVVALLGSDERGTLVVEGLERRGVDTTYIRRIDAPSFWTLSLTVSAGGRSLIQFPTPAFGTDWDGYDRRLLARTKWVHTIAEEADPVGPLLRQSREAGAMTSLDVEFPFVLRADLPAMLPYVDVAFMNSSAAEALGGVDAGARYAHELGAATVLVTLGEAGAFLLDQSGRTLHLDALPTDAVDTNGAGDAFAGAFAAGVIKGFQEHEAAELGIFMAARSTTVLGGHGPDTRLDELRDLAKAAGFAWWDQL